jgi:hypothetical protein
MKHVEDTYPDKFKDEVQSLRLSIVMDGVNPNSLKNINFYVWPVVVLTNNILVDILLMQLIVTVLLYYYNHLAH